MIKTFALAAGLLALSAGAASANIVVVQGGTPGNPPENVLLGSGTTGMTVLGSTNQTNTSITFTGDETLSEPANGQARITTTDGALTYLDIAPTDASLGFTAIEFNIDASQTGSAMIQFFDQFGTAFGGAFTLDQNGQNFFNAIASDGELISHATITSQVPISDVAQIRLGAGPISAVPEPAAWSLLILGFGMVGAGLRARRRTAIA
jgi:hypothetical protein